MRDGFLIPPFPFRCLRFLFLFLLCTDIKHAQIQGYVRTMTFDGECELHKIRHVLDMMRKGTSEAVPNEEELADVDLVLRIKVPDETSAAPLGEKFGAPFDECASLVRVHCCLLQKQTARSLIVPRNHVRSAQPRILA